MPSSAVDQDIRYRARVLLGRWLYQMRAYRRLMPGKPGEGGRIQQRMRAYLDHFLRETSEAEADLDIQPLGARFAVNLNDHMLAPYLRGEATVYEQAEIDFFRRELRSADHLLDIGANHGFWGVSLAKSAGPSAILHLFEANPAIARRLRRTLTLNAGISAALHELAVTDGSSARVRFYRPNATLSGLGSTVLHGVHNYLDPNDHIDVAANSLDVLMDQGVIAGMDVVKIDVEQAEDAVIAGAARALARFRPRLLMVETAPSSQATQALRGLGYSVSRLDTEGQEQALCDSRWGNLLFRMESS